MVKAVTDDSGLVEGDVIGQNQRAGGRNSQPLTNRHTLLFKLFDLFN